MLMQVLLLLALTTRGPQQAHGTGRRGGLSTPVAVRAAGLAESPTVVSLTVESALASAAGAYSRATAEQPLALAAVQAAGLRCIGDRIAQQLFLYRGELASVSPQHIAAMGLIGFIVSGAGNFVWCARYAPLLHPRRSRTHARGTGRCAYRTHAACRINHLEEKLGASVGPWDVLRKAGSDFVCWAPLANCAYLFGVPLLTGATPDLAAHNMQHEVRRPLLIAARHPLQTSQPLCAPFPPFSVISSCRRWEWS